MNIVARTQTVQPIKALCNSYFLANVAGSTPGRAGELKHAALCCSSFEEPQTPSSLAIVRVAAVGGVVDPGESAGVPIPIRQIHFQVVGNAVIQKRKDSGGGRTGADVTARQCKAVVANTCRAAYDMCSSRQQLRL